jgi:hypothetical protein
VGRPGPRLGSYVVPSIPQPLVPDDDGRADPALTAALSAYQAGTADAAAVLTQLGRARLLVPVVAILTSSEVGEHGLRQEKESEMALPKLVGKDGREAVLAFTSVEALARWRPDARPIQVTGAGLGRAALGEHAAAAVVDVAGPVPFVIEGALLYALAALDGSAATPDASAGTVPGVTVARVEAAPEPARRRRGWLRR